MMRSPVTIGLTFAGIFFLYILYAHWPSNLSYRSSYLPSSAFVKVVNPKDSHEWPYRIFISSDLTPPHLEINATGAPLAEGYIFLAPRNRDSHALKSTRPYILSSDNELVYAANYTGGWSKSDFRVQTYKGKPHLTFWRGFLTRGDTTGHGYGEVVFLDDEYAEFSVAPQDESIKTNMDREKLGIADLHEHEMTPWDTVLVTAYNNTPYDLRPINGPEKGWVVDSLVLEVEVATGEVVFMWSALEHLDVRTSHLKRVTYLGDGSRDAPYDFFHVTSVQAVDRGHYLINSRHMWSSYLVSSSDGNIVWEINGATGGDFGPLPDDASFRWTHHARAHNVTDKSITISWLDNHYMPEADKITPSRGLVLQMELPPSKSVSPKLLRHTEQFQLEERFHSPAQGSFQPDLQYGNAFICYGETPVLAEYGSAGDLRWQARYATGNLAQAYRASKQVWHATPKRWGPNLVLRTASTSTTSSTASDSSSQGKVSIKGYVSWNGATDVELWHVYVGADRQALRLAGKALKKGFETVIAIDVPPGSCVQVAAVQHGKEERRSNLACL